MDAHRITTSEASPEADLASAWVRGLDRDRNPKLAWVNSVCLLFLLIGIVGAKRGSISNRQPQPNPEIVPAILEPVPPPPATTQEQSQEQPDQQETAAPAVVAVVPEAPNIVFSVPTIGNLVVPSSLAQAPPLNPLRQVAPLKSIPANLVTTGSGGERPQPPYPKLALEQGQQGTVVLLLHADDAGLISAIEVKQSSGFPILDRNAVDHVKRHWTVPTGSAGRLFEATIHYKLEPR